MRNAMLRRLNRTIQTDPTVQEAIRKDPVQGWLMAVERSSKVPDSWPYRAVIVILGIVVIGTIGAAIVLAALEIEFPSELLTIVSAAAGGLVGILMPVPNE